ATVDANTGVITLKVEDIEVGGTVTAKAKDNGGLIPTEEQPLESEPASETLETATVSYDRNGGVGDMDGQTLNKGSKYTVLPNGFTAPDDSQEFKAWEVDGQEVAPCTEITVNGDTVVKAVWKKVQVDNPNGGSNKNGDDAVKASESRKSGKLSKTGYAGMPYQVAAMILAAGGLLIAAGRKKVRKD
ncbi:UNVERIFIED_CONTAM: InlB B-repeat-containing protein, partial [Bacillus sp. ATCC 13368]